VINYQFTNDMHIIYSNSSNHIIHPTIQSELSTNFSQS
jgi:hypothetical protein